MTSCCSRAWSMTVGEANTEDRVSRGALWARAVFAPSLLFAFALVLAYATYRSVDTVRTGSGPWRLLVIVSWWPYATLADVILSYVNLSLPLAPVAARIALLVVYAVGGVSFVVISCEIFAYGHASAFIALGFSLAAALAGLMAFWLWLDRTYRAVDYLPS